MIQSIFKALLVIVTLLFAISLYHNLKELPPEIITIVEKDTVIVDKIDTLIKTNIEYKYIVKIKRDTAVVSKIDTVIIIRDSIIYSIARFETRFDKIKVGAYAKSKVDSFTFENFPKLVIYNDTTIIYQKRRVPWKWLCGGFVTGVISWEIIR